MTFNFDAVVKMLMALAIALENREENKAHDSCVEDPFVIDDSNTIYEYDKNVAGLILPPINFSTRD